MREEGEERKESEPTHSTNIPWATTACQKKALFWGTMCVQSEPDNLCHKRLTFEGGGQASK